MDTDGPQFAGAVGHPNHEVWLIELGRVTRAAAQLGTICFDLAYIVGGIDAHEMYGDPLGGLQRRLAGITANLPVLPDFLAALETARQTRNDVIHAFLVRDGLLRRSSNDGSDRAFYDVRSLAIARADIELACTLGNDILYDNGGKILEGWRQIN